jgi:putative transposase
LQSQPIEPTDVLDNRRAAERFAMSIGKGYKRASSAEALVKAARYKTIKHYHEPGDLHEFTFSCYRRITLLTNDTWRRYLARSMGEASEQYRFQLVAFVFMPEHVHLLTYPLDGKPDLAGYLNTLKRPVSADVKRDLQRVNSPLLSRLTVRERPGKDAFRFWQEGPGYDRNLQTTTAVLSAIDYIHLNPVRRKLVTQARLWKWSSARFYESDGTEFDPDLPRITPMPAEFWG